MKILKHGEKISLDELLQMSEKMFGDLVKAVVDIEIGSVVLDMEMHVDGEQELLSSGSSQFNLWGINLHPMAKDDNFLEFDSMINLRPAQNNKSRGVENEETRKKIKDLIKEIIIK